MLAQRDRRGFSLIEVLVAMACSSIMIAALYQMFHSQQRSYLKQDNIAEMQQSLRAGLYLMTKDLRSAGFDPNKTANAGFVTNLFSPANATFGPDIDYATATDIIAFTLDANQDGSIQATNAEQVAYRLNAGTLQRFSRAGVTWEAVADNIDALNFVYLNSNGIVTGVPNNIRSVEVSLLVRTGDKDKHYTSTNVYTNKQGTNICPLCINDNYRRRLLSTTIRIRNL